MAQTQANASPALARWWAVVLLPVGLLAGWLAGGLPSPKREEPGAGTSQVVTAMPPRAAAVRPPQVSVEIQKAPEQTRPAEVSRWTTIDDAIAESRHNGKPVLIDFNAEWCPPCQRMKQQVFDDGTRGQAVQTAVIPVSIVDRAREEGRNPTEIEDLQRRYQVNAFPTLIVFSPATGRTMRTQGFGDAERTLAWIQAAAEAVR